MIDRILSVLRWSAITFAGLLIGCQMTPAPNLTSCPLPANDQVKAVLEVVPIGTRREDVAARLSKAGFLGTFNENKSIYYCDIWSREGDLRWHINVSLLFDEDGVLYATNPDREGRTNPSPATNVKTAAGKTQKTEPSLYE